MFCKHQGQQDQQLIFATNIGESVLLDEQHPLRVEVNEDTLRHQELSDEVARMVTADPKAAAELIRRWVGDEI